MIGINTFALVLFCLFRKVNTVFLFTTYNNYCIEEYHSYLKPSPCFYCQKQDFQYNDETKQIYQENIIHTIDEHGKDKMIREEYCLTFDNVHIPIKMDKCNKNGNSRYFIKQQWDLLKSDLSNQKGTLIKVVGLNLCVSILTLDSALHLMDCNWTDNNQVFSLGGSFQYQEPYSGFHKQETFRAEKKTPVSKLKRPNLFRGITR